MFKVLCAGQIDTEQKEEVQSLHTRFVNDEDFGTSAIGEGIALPHCIYSGVSLPLASLGISRQGNDFPSPHGVPVLTKSDKSEDLSVKSGLFPVV